MARFIASAGQTVTIMDPMPLRKHARITIENQAPVNLEDFFHTINRFHVQDPGFFKSDRRVTMQALGWRSERRFLPLQDDIASVVYWYQAELRAPFPELPGRNDREII